MWHLECVEGLLLRVKFLALVEGVESQMKLEVFLGVSAAGPKPHSSPCSAEVASVLAMWFLWIPFFVLGRTSINSQCRALILLSYSVAGN